MRVIAFILSLLTAFYLVPTSVFAASDKDTVKAESTTASTDVTSYPEGTLYEVERLREENVKHFHLEDGTYVAAQYDTAVHVQDSEGKWQDINNTLLSSAGGVYATEDARIKFSKKTTGNGTLFTLKDGEYKLSMSLIGASKGVNAIVTNSADNEQETELNKLMNLEKLSSAIIYEDILSGINLEYVVRSLNVKENIIVKERKDSYSYSFELKLNKLEASVDESGNVLLINSAGDVKYTIPAPVVYDSVYSYADKGVASYSLEGKNGKYTLTVTVDPEWMNADERQFPVTVDPTVTAKPENFGLTKDIFCVFKGNPLELEITDFPSSLISSTTTSVKFGLQYRGAAGHYLPTLKLSYQGATVDAVAPKSFAYQWNITKLALTSNPAAWSNGVSLLVSLVTTGDIINDNGTVWLTAPGTNIEVYNTPIFEVEYYSAVGLEDYYTYSTHDAGIAGSGAINLATGNLTFAIDTLTTTDGLMPFTPTLIYNTAYAGAPYSYSFDGIQTAYTSAYTPHGFMLNMQETIINDYYIDGDYVKNMIIFHDSDGTRHIFEMTDKGVYADTDGLGLIMDVGINTVTITDKSKTVKTYTQASARPTDVNGAWYLSKIEDRVGNAVVFTVDSGYRPTAVSLSPKGSSTITTMLGLSYCDGKLSMVRNDTSGEAVIFKYASPGYLSRVVRAHVTNLNSAVDWDTYYTSGTKTNITEDAICTYSYDSSGRLTQVTNGLTDAYVQYGYDSSGKVVWVTEYSGDSMGQTVKYRYGTGYTEVITSGSDDVIATTDDLIAHYTFDSHGRAVSCYTTGYDGTEVHGASSVRYETQNGIHNSVKEEATIGGESANYLMNGGFEALEYGRAKYWIATDDVSFLSTLYMDGNYSAYMGSAQNTTSEMYQRLYLEKGDYTLSLKYNTANASGKQMLITVTSVSDGSIISQKELPLENADTVYGSTRGSMSFTLTSNTEVKVLISVSNTTSYNSVEVDSVMLERGFDVGDLNLVNMGHFSYSYTTSSGTRISPLEPWSYDESTSVNIVYDNTFKSVAKVSDGAIKQTVYTADSSDLAEFGTTGFDTNINHTYTVSGFGYATSQMGSGVFRLAVNVYYYQGANKDDVCVTHYCDFKGESGRWQFATATVDLRISDDDKPKKNADYSCVRAIELVCEYSGQDTDAYAMFDNIGFTEASSGVRYTYSSTGYVLRAESSTYSEYYGYDNNNNLNMKANNEGDLYEYTYDLSTNLLSEEKYYTFTYGEGNGTYFPYYLSEPQDAVTKTLVYYSMYSYIQPGLLVSTQTYSGDGSLSITSSATYETSAGTKIFGAKLSETDTLGNTTRYFYDSKNGRLIATTSGGSGVAYNYDGLGRIISVKAATPTAGSYTTESFADAEYGYTAEGYLSYIRTATTDYSFYYDSFGNTESVDIGRDNIVSYEYNQRNGKLKKVNYSNGFSEEYVYSPLEMMSEIWYNYSDGTRELAVEYVYTDDGQLHSVRDNLTGTTTVYEYDSSDRLVGTAEFDTEQLNIYYATQTRYNAYTSDVLSFGNYFEYLAGGVYKDTQLRYDFEYNADGSLDELTVTPYSYSDRLVTSYSYDALKRLSSVNYAGQNGFTRNESYSYVTSESGSTSGRIHSFTATTGSESTVYTYTYDALGNITRIAAGNKTIRYTYDNRNRLVREDNQLHGWTYTYEYDNAGNVVKKSQYGFTLGALSYTGYVTELEYSDQDGGDCLVTREGHVLTYDSLGNPLTYYNGLDYTFSWEGRRLKAAAVSGYNLSYTYNSDGIRTRKVVNGVEHKYYLNGSQIVAEEWGNNLLVYIYDASGSPIGMMYRTTSYAAGEFDIFWYDKNLQGDIVAVYNDSGNKLISYTYDAWGNYNQTLSSGAYGSAALYNPFKYRGYYYDTDLQMYYLNARYYDPQNMRFISMDNIEVVTATPGGLTDKNLYAYCDGNPIMRVDGDGEFWGTTLGIMAIGGLIGAGISAISSIVVQKAFSDEVNWASVGVAAATGFVSGAVAASPLGQKGQAILGGIIGGASYVADAYVNNTDVTLDGFLISASLGGLFGWLGGDGANYKSTLSNTVDSTREAIQRENRRVNQRYASKAILSAKSYRNNILESAAWSTGAKFTLTTSASNFLNSLYSNHRIFSFF